MSTEIEFCSETWNPMPDKDFGPVWRGDYCGGKREWPVIDDPLHWKSPRVVFVNSMGDTFHDFWTLENKWENAPSLYKKNKYPHIFHRILFSTVNACSQHFFIFVTKRPENIIPALYDSDIFGSGDDYLKNVIFIATCENQEMADKRIPELVKLKRVAPWKTGISVEPMLGPVSVEGIIEKGEINGATRKIPYDNLIAPQLYIDWIICGAETGQNKRPMKNEWPFALLGEARQYKIPFFFKKDSEGIGALLCGWRHRIVREFPEFMMPFMKDL